MGSAQAEFRSKGIPGQAAPAGNTVNAAYNAVLKAAVPLVKPYVERPQDWDYLDARTEFELSEGLGNGP